MGLEFLVCRQLYEGNVMGKLDQKKKKSSQSPAVVARVSEPLAGGTITSFPFPPHSITQTQRPPFSQVPSKIGEVPRRTRNFERFLIREKVIPGHVEEIV